MVVLALLLCVAASAIVVRVSRLPLPLTQIALGAAVSVPDVGLHVELEPHLFLLLFVPPLLFVDGWRMPKREFFQLRERILALAFGLVLVTVVAVGYLLHWMIPAMPLAVAFALAAVLSPTDAVAVSALAGGAGIPKRLAYILEGEALMNDASGLTAFKFAIAAAATGAFSLAQASVAFVLVSVGGLLVGIAMGWGMALFQRWLSGWTRIQAQGVIVLTLLLPFAAYLLAEHVGTSGILAAVAAGMTLNLRSAAIETEAETRIANTHIWSMLQYVLTGVIFVLLGLQLPEIIGKALHDEYHDDGLSGAVRLLGYAGATTAALIGVRLLWVWALLRITHIYARWRDGVRRRMPQLRLLLATGLAGVRGAITLAAVLSVPLALTDGTPFPERNLMIFIATAVILLSLMMAAIGLPLLLRGLDIGEDHEAREEQVARLRACEAGIAAVAAEARQMSGAAGAGSDVTPQLAAASQIIDTYQQRLSGLTGDENLRQTAAEQASILLTLRLRALRAERAEILRMHRRDEINDVVFNQLIYEIDMRESAFKPRAGRGDPHARG